MSETTELSERATVFVKAAADAKAVAERMEALNTIPSDGNRVALVLKMISEIAVGLGMVAESVQAIGQQLATEDIASHVEGQ